MCFAMPGAMPDEIPSAGFINISLNGGDHRSTQR
jgi:hypothetical protein